jgi:flagellar biosynthesis chaperone FliJ
MDTTNYDAEIARAQAEVNKLKAQVQAARQRFLERTANCTANWYKDRKGRGVNP